jgi:hypothetical protein
MAKTPQVGEQAPDFELEGTDGPFRLSEHRGERVVLLFYPADESMVCTKQFCSYRDRADDFAALDATVVGISAQDLASHEQFIAKHGLNVPLLADVEKTTCWGSTTSRLTSSSPRWRLCPLPLLDDDRSACGTCRARRGLAAAPLLLGGVSRVDLGQLQLEAARSFARAR